MFLGSHVRLNFNESSPKFFARVALLGFAVVTRYGLGPIELLVLRGLLEKAPKLLRIGPRIEGGDLLVALFFICYDARHANRGRG